MDAIAARIQSILDQTHWSARELSRRAKLPSETHVGLILKRGGAKAGGEALAKIAAAAGVTERWLLTGEGPREAETTIDYDDRYANRAAVIELLARDVHPRAVEALRGYDFHGTDKSRAEWTRWLLEEDSRAKREDSAAPAPTAKPAPKRPRRK